MKRALITGILGQDGTYLARLLVRHGYEVHGLIRLPFDREEHRIKRRFTADEQAQLRFHTGSLEDPYSLLQILKKANAEEIYHLAGVSDSRQSFIVPEQTVQTITLGTLRLLEAVRAEASAAKIFLASSAEVFGVPATTPQDESTLRQPLTPYGVSKQAADQFARIYREKYKQFISVGILYNHESPLRPANYLSRRVAQAVAAIKAGKLKKLTLGDLTAERDWSDARDFVEGYRLALQAPKADEYVFASGKSHKVKDLVQCAFEAGGLNWQEFVEGSSGVPTEVKGGLLGNTARAEQQLGWKRRWTFEATIRDMVAAEIEERPEIDRANPLCR